MSKMFFAESTGGFYDLTLHGDKIPRDAVEITADEHAALLDGQSNGKRIVADVGGRPVLSDPPPLTSNQLRKIVLAKINEACESGISALQDGYPPGEVLSWSKQETEARAWVVNNDASTPLLDSLSAARSIDKADLVGRIIDKADAFALFSGALIGKRQALEDALNALPADATVEQIAAITW